MTKRAVTVRYQGQALTLLTHMRMITPGMARSLTPTEFVERPKREPRPPRQRHLLAAAGAALRRLAHTLRHRRLRHISH